MRQVRENSRVLTVVTDYYSKNGIGCVIIEVGNWEVYWRREKLLLQNF